jgi:guanosine-3',5'-bis(diphosphate) 3'-pyrophosphohydrolase
MKLLTKAMILAAETHDEDVDKGKQEYILHPTRVVANVMSKKLRNLKIFKNVLSDVFKKAIIVAWLHDVVEDSRLKKNPVTYDMLRTMGFDEDIIEALDCVTNRPGETYPEFIARAMTNMIAMIVKVADIMDNMDLTRIPYPTEHDIKRVRTKYIPALHQMGAEELLLTA